MQSFCMTYRKIINIFSALLIIISLKFTFIPSESGKKTSGKKIVLRGSIVELFNLFNDCQWIRLILRSRLNYLFSVARYVGSQKRNLPIKHRRPSYAATALCRDVQHRAKWGNSSAQSKRYRDRWIHVSTCVQKVFHIKRIKEYKKTYRGLRDSSLVSCHLIDASSQ